MAQLGLLHNHVDLRSGSQHPLEQLGAELERWLYGKSSCCISQTPDFNPEPMRKERLAPESSPLISICTLGKHVHARTPSFSHMSAHTQRCLGAVLCACSPRAGDTGTGGSWGLLASQYSQLVSYRFEGRPCLTKLKVVSD